MHKEKTSEEGIDAVKKYAEKLRRENKERKPDENEPTGLLVGGPQYIFVDLDDEND